MNIKNILKKYVDTTKQTLSLDQVNFLLSLDNNYFDMLNDEIYKTYMVNTNILVEYNNISLDTIDYHINIPLLQDNIVSKKIKIYNGKNIPSEFCLRAINLQDVRILDGIEIINEDAFSDCLLLKRITIPKSVKIIHNCVFSNCVSLEQLILPKTIEFIGNNAFRNCINLKKIYFV